jgi:hypothetical protein
MAGEDAGTGRVAPWRIRIGPVADVVGSIEAEKAGVYA